MVKSTLNLYCFDKNILLKDPSECLACDFKGKIIFKERDFISCPNCRLAENLKYNVIMPLKITPIGSEILPSKKIDTILIVRTGGGLGDIVVTTPVARGLREKFPDKKIYYHCHEKYKDILEGNPDLDGIITERKANDGYDLVIELDNPCPCYIYEARSIQNRQAITKPRIDLFCERAGVDPKDKLPFVKVNKSESDWIDEFFREKKVKKVKIAIAPTSAEMMKNWPIERIKELVPMINKNLNATVFILHDLPILVDDTIGFFAYPLKKVIALASKMDLVVGVDSAFIHLSGALQRPIIGLFGVNEPVRVMYYNKYKSWIYKKEQFKCSPCYYLHTCLKYPSPCMEAITAEEVFNEIKKRLSDKMP